MMQEIIFQLFEVELASLVEEIILTSLLGTGMIAVKLFKSASRSKTKDTILGKVFEELNDELVDKILSKLDDKEKKEITIKDTEKNENDKKGFSN